MATVTMNALGVTRTVNMPDSSLPEWAEAYHIPKTDEDGNNLTNQQRVNLLFTALIERMTRQVEKLRRRKTVINTGDIISET